jgi:YfiH family protein
MKMKLKNLNKLCPFSGLGPQWAGVGVLVTEAGFQNDTELNSTYGFNLGTHVGDSASDVQSRREAVQDHVGAPILWLNQVHGNEVYTCNSQSDFSQISFEPKADASITTSSRIVLAIMTADCLPVVFAAFDHSGNALGVAAAHAGWRGLFSGVLQAAAKSLRLACSAPVDHIKIWMGPAIGPSSFEVGQDVYDAFVNQNLANQFGFSRGINPNKYLANIYQLAKIALDDHVESLIEGGGYDTFTDVRWFSHRRGQQQNKPVGRFATLIRLLPGQGV